MGECYINCTSTINGEKYTFDKDGHMLDNSLVSDKLVDFVKSFEGFYATKYDDGTGVITQGYGCIGDEISDWGDTITEKEASDRLKKLINNKYASVIKDDLDSKDIVLTQYQFDSLCSMSYNIGTGGLLNSTLYKRICQGVRDESLKDNFCSWSKAGGRTMQGLLNRRIKEYNVFANADYTGNC